MTDGDERPVADVRVVVLHELHHPRLCAEVVDKPEGAYPLVSTRGHPAAERDYPLLAPLAVLHVLPDIGDGNSEDRRILRVHEVANERPGMVAEGQRLPLGSKGAWGTALEQLAVVLVQPVRVVLPEFVALVRGGPR